MIPKEIQRSFFGFHAALMVLTGAGATGGVTYRLLAKFSNFDLSAKIVIVFFVSELSVLSLSKLARWLNR